LWGRVRKKRDHVGPHNLPCFYWGGRDGLLSAASMDGSKKINIKLSRHHVNKKKIRRPILYVIFYWPSMDAGNGLVDLSRHIERLFVDVVTSRNARSRLPVP